MSSKRLGKYACLELERRYLLRELPADLAGQENSWFITESRAETTLTNIYLNDKEYHCLSKLDAREIIKKRHKYVYGGLEYGIDVFEGELEGLILAEVECEKEQEFERLQIPSFALREVTDDLFLMVHYIWAKGRKPGKKATYSSSQPNSITDRSCTLLNRNA
jgi:hypothetical protein